MRDAHRILLSLIAVCALCGPLAAATEIGAVAAVNRDIEGTPPNEAARSLLIGDRLIANERLVSSALGSGQMLFLDQTSLTVSPNSEIVLDKYVYDPATQTGEIGVTLARGVLRMIGGRITKTTDAVVRTPTATIGIRGGIALIVVDDARRTRVMHIAGEYTRVASGGETLTLSRSNALASVDGEAAPSYDGVGSEEDVAALYDQMQGGGGGSEETVTNEVVESSGVSELNSEEPDAVVDEPISTSGESGAKDKSAELEQVNIATDAKVQREVQPKTPDNPFANFIGGAIFADAEPVIDDQGELIANPSAQNFFFGGDGLFGRFSSGSLIADFEDGTRARLPTPPKSGFFPVLPENSQTPDGPAFGAGYADFQAGLLFYSLTTPAGEGASVMGAEPGPTQLRNLNTTTNAFRATRFNVLPDLAISLDETAQPFLPAGLGEVFDNGAPTRLFLINPPNRATFGPGAGFGTSRGSKWLIPQFSLSGAGVDQRFLLHVGATGVLNNGDGSPDLTSFGRGAFRLDPFRFATRIQPFVGATGVPDRPGDNDDSGITVFGRNDDYLLLGNSSYYHDGPDPDEEVAASFFQNIGDGGFDTYGNLHLAERIASQTVSVANRIRIGAGPGAYVNETGRVAANQFAANEARFLSFGYSANVGGLSGPGAPNAKMAMRTSAVFGGGAGFFTRQKAEGAMVLDMDDVIGDGTILGVRLAFGGNRSAVFDDRRYGMREHEDPKSLDGLLSDSGTPAQVIDTNAGPQFGIAGDEFGQRAFRGALLPSTLADSSAIFPPGTDVTPQYLTWGWWTGQFRFAEAPAPGAPFDDARLQFSLGTFVAGDRTNILPTAGVATFNGPVVVNALTGAGADFVDGGRFRMIWDFSEASGQAEFVNVLDYPLIAVPVSLSGAIGRNHYGGGALINGNTDQNVIVDGSFFDGPGQNDARATAGSILIDDIPNDRTAVGSFWGER